MLSTVIGSYPKPDYLKVTDWFNAPDGTDTAHPTMLYNTEVKKLGKQAEKIFQQATRDVINDQIRNQHFRSKISKFEVNYYIF